MNIYFKLFSSRWDAVTDQIQKQNIPGVPRNPHDLRTAACNAINFLPQRFIWVETLFENNFDLLSDFIRTQSRNMVFTDDPGVVCMATALYLGKIHYFP